MKKLFSLLGVVVISCALVGCDSNNGGDVIIEEVETNDAVIDYNDNLVDLTADCFASEDDVRAVYDAGSSEELQASIDNTVALCNVALENVKAVEAWEGDATLRDGVVAILEGEISYYTKLEDIVQYQDYSDEDFDNMPEDEADAYEAAVLELENIRVANDELNDNLVTIQEEFASNHGYELEAE